MEVPPGWDYNPSRGAFCHIRPGIDIEFNEDLPADAIDVVLPMRHAKRFLQYVIENMPELITTYKGRDKQDITVIHRLIDIIEKSMSKSGDNHD